MLVLRSGCVQYCKRRFRSRHTKQERHINTPTPTYTIYVQLYIHPPVRAYFKQNLYTCTKSNNRYRVHLKGWGPGVWGRVQGEAPEAATLIEFGRPTRHLGAFWYQLSNQHFIIIAITNLKVFITKVPLYFLRVTFCN